MLSRCEQEEHKDGQRKFGITAKPGNGSPAKAMPEPLPVIFIKHTSTEAAASMFPLGKNELWTSFLLPIRMMIMQMCILVCISTDSQNTPYHAGRLATFSPCILPSGGTPLLDSGIIQRMQAALIPKQMPRTVTVNGEGRLDILNSTMCVIKRRVLCT